jgi:hypothetical protein
MIRKIIRQRQIDKGKQRDLWTRKFVLCAARLSHRLLSDHEIEFIAQRVSGEMPKHLARRLSSARYTEAMLPVMMMTHRYIKLIDPA